ncbi:MAG TPA: histidine phosphatase family protein [Propionicimonas sp.]|uniref:histidine phosphatase family protein n=1 Tax=Propionicimonas sp. TaxID=1955623 RepID=UPI002F41AC1E
MTAGSIVLLRHGVTDWNDGGRFQGHADIPLNDAGREQAIAAGELLRGAGITRAVSSDLSRASETARLVTAGWGVGVEVDARLREVNVGSWAGMNIDDIGRDVPDFWPAIREGRDFRRSPTGESATEAGRRVALAVLDHAEAADDGEVLLVVGHGLSLRVAALLLMGLDYSHARLFGGLVNCHWMVLGPGEDHWRLLTYNAGAND